VENIGARITTQLAAREQTGLALLPIFRRGEGDFIGYGGLIVGNASVDEPEIAYELLQRAHGCGRGGSRGARSGDRHGAYATLSDGARWNAPSFRVLEKLGFDRDHVWTPDDRGEMVWMTRALP
jgi:hypothetical protein